LLEAAVAVQHTAVVEALAAIAVQLAASSLALSLRLNLPSQ